MSVNPLNTVLIGNIPVEDEGITESISWEKQEVTRQVRVDWANRWPLYVLLLGGGTTVVTTRTNPLTYPDAPWLWVNNVELMEMLGTPSEGPNGVVAYDTARLKITYGFPQFGKNDKDVESNITSDIGEEMITLPADQAVFQWGGGPNNGKPLPPDVLPSIPTTTGTLSYALKFQVGRPTSFLEQFVDTTNDAVFLGYAAGTLLYKGFGSQPIFSSAGVTQTNVTHKWKYRSNGGNGWNYFLDPGNGWQPIQRIDNAAPPFPPKSHGTIIGI